MTTKSERRTSVSSSTVCITNRFMNQSNMQISSSATSFIFAALALEVAELSKQNTSKNILKIFML